MSGIRGCRRRLVNKTSGQYYFDVFFFLFLNFKLALKTQVHPTMHACMASPSPNTHAVTSQSSINNPYLPGLSESDWSDPYDVQLGLRLPACAPPATTLPRRERRRMKSHEMTGELPCWARVCVCGGGLNKLTKLIVGRLMTSPMMQRAVFQQRITQKSCDGRGPLRASMENFITLQKFPCLIHPPPFRCANNLPPPWMH